VLVSEFTVFTDFLTNHILDVLHVPELLISCESISEGVPVEEVGNELQPTSEVLVENFVSQVLKVLDGAAPVLDCFLEDSVSVKKLLVSLLQLHDLLVQRELAQSVVFAPTGLIGAEVHGGLPLDVLSDESGHLAFLDHAVSVDIELLEEDVELVNRHCLLAFHGQELVQEVEGFQLVQLTAAIFVVPSPNLIDGLVSVIIGCVRVSQVLLYLYDLLLLLLDLALEVSYLCVFVSQLRLERDKLMNIFLADMRFLCQKGKPLALTD
jgi:hypothetical protein